MLECDRVCHKTVSVKAIVFAQYSPDIEVAASSYSPGKTAIELLRNCINFADHKQTAMQQVSQLVKQALGLQLTFSNAKAATGWLEKRRD